MVESVIKIANDYDFGLGRICEKEWRKTGTENGGWVNFLDCMIREFCCRKEKKLSYLYHAAINNEKRKRVL